MIRSRFGGAQHTSTRFPDGFHQPSPHGFAILKLTLPGTTLSSKDVLNKSHMAARYGAAGRGTGWTSSPKRGTGQGMTRVGCAWCILDCCCCLAGWLVPWQIGSSSPPTGTLTSSGERLDHSAEPLLHLRRRGFRASLDPYLRNQYFPVGAVPKGSDGSWDRGFVAAQDTDCCLEDKSFRIALGSDAIASSSRVGSRYWIPAILLGMASSCSGYSR